MKQRPHERSTRMFASLAGAFDVEVEPFDNDKWSAAITMAKALDNLVDDDHIYDSGLYAERVTQGQPIPYLTRDEVEFVRSTYDQLGERSKEQWHSSAAQLGTFAIRRLEADNIHDYIDVVLDESPLMARVLQVENDEARRDHEARQRFNTWMVQAVRTMFILDTCSDFVKDHNDGNMNLALTPQAIGVLTQRALAESVNMARLTPVTVYPVLLRRSVTKAAEKASQPNFWSNQFVWKRSS